MIRTALVGCGTWGRNVLREIAASPEAELVAVVDPAEAAGERARSVVAGVRVVPALGDAVAMGLDAVVVASPPPLHAEHALGALGAGAHVLVEKPLATDEASADAMLEAARRSGKVAMVGHILAYHPAARALVELVGRGELGAVRYATATRLSSRRSNHESVVWALGPHDLSLFRAIAASPLVNAEIELGGDDVAFVRGEVASKLACHVELSRAHAGRERRFTVVGERAVGVFDDGGDRPIVSVYDRPVDDARSVSELPASSRRDVAFEPRQPLAAELAHFFGCIRAGTEPRTGFDEGAEVVRVLHRGLESARSDRGLRTARFARENA